MLPQLLTYISVRTNSLLTLDFVKSRLLQEDARQTKNTDQEASQVFGAQKKKYNQKHIFPFKCFKCGVKGHKKQDCPQNKESTSTTCTNNANVTEHEEEVAFISSLCTEKNDILPDTVNFVVDSGATNHLVTQSMEKYLVNSKKVKHEIKFAKQGVSVEAHLEGSLNLKTNSGRRIQLENVLVCKNLSQFAFSEED